MELRWWHLICRLVQVSGAVDEKLYFIVLLIFPLVSLPCLVSINSQPSTTENYCRKNAFAFFKVIISNCFSFSFLHKFQAVFA